MLSFAYQKENLCLHTHQQDPVQPKNITLIMDQTKCIAQFNSDHLSWNIKDLLLT